MVEVRILNIHRRFIKASKQEIEEVLQTLSQDNDLVWPDRDWPKMRFEDGFEVGNKGGHGPIRYTITKLTRWNYIEFTFTKPKGFHGTHVFELLECDNQCELIHTIDIKTTIVAYLKWIIAIRWLHDALIEDAFDKIQNQLKGSKRKTPWNLYVRFLRMILK